MNKPSISRPTSVTIISWLLIVLAIISLLTNVFGSSNPKTKELMMLSSIPIAYQYFELYFGIVVKLVCGIAMLKRQNWGRHFYLAWLCWGVLVTALALPARPNAASGVMTGALVQLASMPDLFYTAIVAFFLYSAKSKHYFHHQNEGPNYIFSEKISFNLLAYIALMLVAFYLLSWISLNAFLQNGLTSLSIVFIYFVASIVLVLIAAKISKKHKWDKSLGFIFKCSAVAGTVVFFLIRMATWLPDYGKKAVITDAVNNMNLLRGFAFVTVYFALGFVLQNKTKKTVNKILPEQVTSIKNT